MLNRNHLAALLALGTLIAPPTALSAGPPKDDPRTANPEGTDIFDSLRIDTRKHDDGGRRLAPLITKRVVASGKRWALLVGVRQAEFNKIKQQPLDACHLDISAMRATLTGAGYECVVLCDAASDAVKPATVKGVMNALRELCAKAGPSDQILVYASSHGGVIKDQPYVLVSDGGVNINEVKKELASSKALVRMLLLDCCRDNKGFPRISNEYRDVHTITACRPDEVSGLGPNGLSIFTEVFVDALTDCRADRIKDGQLELDEVLHYLDSEVPKRARKYHPELSQNPTRTVVDAKSLNPIIASCIAGPGPQPTAFDGPSLAAGRNDWLLTSLLIVPVQPGMTMEQVEKTMKRKPDDATAFDPQGNAKALYDNAPTDGDAMLVYFENSKVARVQLILKKMCKGEFNAANTRAAIDKLIGAEPVVSLIGHIKGLDVGQITAKLGCATDALIAPDGKGSGQLRYAGVPRPSQSLRIIITDSKCEDLEVTADLP